MSSNQPHENVTALEDDVVCLKDENAMLRKELDRVKAHVTNLAKCLDVAEAAADQWRDLYQAR